MRTVRLAAQMHGTVQSHECVLNMNWHMVALYKQLISRTALFRKELAKPFDGSRWRPRELP